MKAKLMYVLFFLSIGQVALVNKASAQASVNFQVFYDELSPYGTWINSNDYGYVWSPDLGSTFIPYGTNGYWTYTADGWTWVSDYEWGWAPFHYGRWYFDAIYGPLWIPDYEWAPAWVSWRRSGDYYGWAPLGPRMRPGDDDHGQLNNHWSFVNSKDMGRKDLSSHFIGNDQRNEIFKNSMVMNNIRTDNVRNIKFDSGPDKAEIEKSGGRPIKQVAVRENDKPVQHMQNNQLQLYRPRIDANPPAPKPAPQRVGDWNDIKPMNERPATGGRGEQGRGRH